MLELTLMTIAFTSLIYFGVWVVILIIHDIVTYKEKDYTSACRHIIYHCSDKERSYWINRITNHMGIPGSFVDECEQCQEQNNSSGDPKD